MASHSKNSSAFVGAVKRLAESDAVQKAATGAIASVAATAAKYGGKKATGRRGKKDARIKAQNLARQIGGKYSDDTVLGGELRYVVWKRDRPVATFPPFAGGTSEAELAACPELQDFNLSLLKEPPAKS